jgi:hypothetical protein
MPWGHCQRLTLTLAGDEPDGIGILPIDRCVHTIPCGARSFDRATRSVGDVEEHPLGIRAVDALHRGGPVAHTVPRT